MKRIGLLLVLLVVSLGASAQQGFVAGRAVGKDPFRGGMVALANGQVRVCQGNDNMLVSPCPDLATIYDTSGNLINNNIGGRFGQITTDGMGRYNFQCVPGNLLIQELGSGNNSPTNTFYLTCPGTGTGGGGPGVSYPGVTSNGSQGLTIGGTPVANTDADTVGARNSAINTAFHPTGNANLIYATPDGVSGSAILRALTANDMPGTVVMTPFTNVYSAGAKQVFTSSATQAGEQSAPIAADPGAPQAGDRWYNSTLGHLRVSDGIVIHTLMYADDPVSGSLVNPMTASGDMMYGATGGTPTRLPASTLGALGVLTQSPGGIPFWALATSLPYAPPASNDNTLAGNSATVPPSQSAVTFYVTAHAGTSLPGCASDSASGMTCSGQGAFSGGVVVGTGPVSVTTLATRTGVTLHDEVAVYDSSDCSTQNTSKAATCQCLAVTSGSCTQWVAEGGGATTVQFNGNQVTNPNINSNTPGAQSGYTPVTIQVLGSNVSMEVPTPTFNGLPDKPIATGNGTKYCSVNGTLTTGDIVTVDSNGNCVDSGTTLAFILGNLTFPSITTVNLPDAIYNAAYTPQTLGGAGGTSPYAYALQTGSTLPTGMTLSSAGVLSGTPTTGSTSPTFTITDASSKINTRALAVNVDAPAPTMAPVAGTYTSSQTVTLSDTLAGVTFLTCQDTPGTCTPSVAGSSVTVSSTGHLRAQATKTGFVSSAVTDAAYTISVATQAATPTFSPVAGSYSGTQNVTTSTTTTACNNSTYLYTGTANPPTTAGNTATVSASGTIYSYVHGCPSYTDSTVASAAYTITGGTMAAVQGKVNNSATAAVSATTTSNITSGNLLVVLSKTESTSTPTVTISSTGPCNGHWVQAVAPVSQTAGTSWYTATVSTCLIPSTASETVTATWSGGGSGTFTDIDVAEYSASTGWKNPVLDVVSTQVNTNTIGSVISTAPITTTNAHDLILLLGENFNAAETWATVPSGYAYRSASSRNTAGWFDQFATATGTFNPSITLQSTDASIGIMVSLKAN